eukprot:s2322_g11.t1
MEKRLEAFVAAQLTPALPTKVATPEEAGAKPEPEPETQPPAKTKGSEEEAKPSAAGPGKVLRKALQDLSLSAADGKAAKESAAGFGKEQP